MEAFTVATLGVVMFTGIVLLLVVMILLAKKKLVAAGDVRILVNDHPLHEWFHGRLISALHQAGRRAEALQAYQNLYLILRRELGLEPAEELQRLQADILNASTDGPLPHRGRPKALSSPVGFTRPQDSAVAS